jgi:hypothetical protein
LVLPAAGVMLSCTGLAAVELWLPDVPPPDVPPVAAPDPDWQAAASRPAAQITTSGSDRCRRDEVLASTRCPPRLIRSVVY